MKIDHIAIWVNDIESIREFYVKYFDMVSSEKYVNNQKGFTSYFLSPKDGGARIELMHRLDIQEVQTKRGFSEGLAHISLSFGSRAVVDQLTERFRSDGYEVASEPRVTGDGYYESAILDCEGNYIEISE